MIIFSNNALKGLPTNNPNTGGRGCPTGFKPEQVLGTHNVDYGLYYCSKDITE